MKFHTLKNAPTRPMDLVFRESWLHKLLGFLISLAVLAAPIVILSRGGVWREDGFGGFTRIFLVFVTLFMTLVPLFMGAVLRHALHPQNWIVRGRPGGVLIKFRSYLNEHFPADRPVVVELEAAEIAWLGVTRERRITPGRQKGEGVHAENFTFLDIKPAFDDLSALKTLLYEERMLKVSLKYEDNPVYIVTGGIIRIKWRSGGTRVTPGAAWAVAQLARVLPVSVRPQVKTVNDLMAGPGDDARARENKILAMAESGDTLGAVKVARKHYGFSLNEALQFVEELQGKKSEPLCRK